MPPSYPSLSAVSGAIERIDGKVDTLEGQNSAIKLEVGLLAGEVKANRERAEERHTELLGRFKKLDENSQAGRPPAPKPRLWGLAPGTGREVGIAVAIVSTSVATIVAAYLGGQSGSTTTTAEVVEKVEAAVEVIEARVPPAPAPVPAPVVPAPLEEPADTDTDTDLPPDEPARPALLPLRRP
jgi:hypothetical protein